MKNLPDDELFNALENRLRNYSEQPDYEVWRKIATTLPTSREPGWIVWTNRVATVFSLAALLFLLYDEDGKNESLRELQITPENSISKQTETQSKILSTEANEGEADPGKDNNLTDTEKLYASRHRANVPFSMIRPSIAKMLSDNNDNLALLSESPAIIEYELWNEKKMPSDTDSLQVVNRIKEDPIPAVVQKESPQKKQRKLSGIIFYTMFTPSLSFQHVSPISNDNVVIEKLNSPPVFSVDRLGISVEAGVQGKITNRMQYIAGLSYYHQSQHMEYEQQSADNVIIESGDDMSYIVRPGTMQKSFEYSMRNIGIHAGLLYTLKQHGLIHKAGIALRFERGLQRAEENDVYDNTASNYLNYQLLYRIEYVLNPKMNLFVQPSYTHTVIANESLQAPFRLKQSRAGIGIGFVYSF